MTSLNSTHNLHALPFLNRVCYLLPAGPLEDDTVLGILKEYAKCWVRLGNSKGQGPQSALRTANICPPLCPTGGAVWAGAYPLGHAHLSGFLAHSPLPNRGCRLGTVLHPTLPKAPLHPFVSLDLPAIGKSFPCLQRDCLHIASSPSQARGPRFLGSQHSAWLAVDLQNLWTACWPWGWGTVP